MTFIEPTTERNVNARGCIMPQKIRIDATVDDAGTPGVVMTLTLPTGDAMSFAISVDHAADLAIALATFLSAPDSENHG
jgi:hypothetical protein